MLEIKWKHIEQLMEIYHLRIRRKTETTWEFINDGKVFATLEGDWWNDTFVLSIIPTEEETIIDTSNLPKWVFQLEPMEVTESDNGDND